MIALPASASASASASAIAIPMSIAMPIVVVVALLRLPSLHMRRDLAANYPCNALEHATPTCRHTHTHTNTYIPYVLE